MDPIAPVVPAAPAAAQQTVPAAPAAPAVVPVAPSARRNPYAAPKAAPVRPATPVAAAPTAAPLPAAPIAPKTTASARSIAPRAQREIDRLTRQTAKLSADLASVEGLRTVIAEHAKTQLDALPADNLRAYVTKLAGKDPARQLEAINNLRAHGLLAAPTGPGATTGPKPGDASVPAAKGVEATDEAIVAKYEKMRAAGAPMLAEQYRNQHRAVFARVQSVH